MTSCSIGAAERLPSLTSKTTHLPRNGDKTGAFHCIAGTKCARTAMRGGGSASGLSDAFFISFALITCLDFIASMPSRGGRGRISNFFRSIGIKCSNELAAAHHISLHVTTKVPKTPRRTNVKARNTYALIWTKQAPRE